MRLPHSELDVPGSPPLRVIRRVRSGPARGTMILAFGAHPVAAAWGDPPGSLVTFDEAEAFDMGDLISYAVRSDKHGPVSILELIHYLGVEYATSRAVRAAETAGQRVVRLMSSRRDLLSVRVVPGPPLPLSDAVSVGRTLDVHGVANSGRNGALPPVDTSGRGLFELWLGGRWTPIPAPISMR